jgi:glutamate-1-semialdehyde 2,1-aminomutase
MELAMNAPVTNSLYEKAKNIIPGEVQLFSKKPELFAPGSWPAYYSKAIGCEVWDLDNNHYYDFSTNGIGACILGFNHPNISEAAKKAIDNGCMSSLNPPEEIALAERLCELHPWASKVRFTRCGGESMAVAVRIARAATGRSMIAVCGYHGWHDWYLAANLGNDSSLDGHLLPGLAPLGVPRELLGTTKTFAFNDTEALKVILEQHGSKLAAIVMEPCRHHFPNSEFINIVREGASKTGAALIFDEITIGFRLHYGGAHLKMGVHPDIAVFAKALGNGHPIGAVIGVPAFMDAAKYSFISSTYWTERVGPAAALAVLDEMSRTNVPEYIAGIGQAVKDTWRKMAEKHKVQVNIDDGFPCLSQFAFAHKQSQELKTLFTQFMIEEGFLAGTGFYPTMAHNAEILSKYGLALDRVFSKLSKIIETDSIAKSMSGAPAQKTFARLLK